MSKAAAALVAAARSNDAAALRTILGPGSAPLISSGDKYADEAALRHFIELYDANHALVPEGADHVMLEVGANGWPLPIPIVRRAGRWSFDAREGAQEIIDRRIGRNEIAAIRVCLAYVDAQNDYFERKKQETGSGVYAQQLVSAQGRHDGLYWPAGDGQEESPLEPLVAQARDEGYPGPNAAPEFGAIPGLPLSYPAFAGRGGARRREEICAEWPNDRRIRVDRLASELRLVGHHELYCQSGRGCIPKGPRAADSTKRGKYNAI